MGTVVGLFSTRDEARRAAEAIKAAGFAPEDVSVVMRDRGEAADVESDAGVGGGAATGALGGGLLGGAAGLALGLGALTIPGIGPILAAGPIAAALAGTAIGATAGGVLGALVEAGVPEDEAEHFHEGVKRGGVLLTVKTPKGREDEARGILKRHGLRDISADRARWEREPDFSYEATAPAATVAAGTKADTKKPGRTKMADKKTNDGVDRARVDGKAGGTAVGGTAGAVIGGVVGGPIGAGVGAVAGSAIGGAAGAMMDDREFHEVAPEFRHEWERGPYKASSSWDEASSAYQYGWDLSAKPEYHGRSWDEVRKDLGTNWSGKGPWKDYEPMARAAWERRAACRVESGGDAVIPIVEEEVQVGKREVSKGGVRVETRVTEKPVEAQVHLHEEKVNVRRRPASRAASGDDLAAMQGGTIEMAETAEEAVVKKTAKVVEEVVINKTGRDRTETVRDTVRKTDVDVKKVDTPVTGQACEVEETTTKGRGKKG